MILSMTAFARKANETERGLLVWEMKSVNHRYLELSFRLPEEWRWLEVDLRERIKADIHRGKIDINLKWLPRAVETNRFNINRERFNQLLSITQKIHDVHPEIAPLSMGELLDMPGVLEESQILNESRCNSNSGGDKHDEDKNILLEAFHLLIFEFLASRQREGQSLQKILHTRIDKLTKHTQIILDQMPLLLQAQQARLREQIEQVEIKFDESRFEQELVYLAQKADVSEELDRLMTHLQVLRNDLNVGGVIGRRLDFLLQEVNRETNTLCAKSICGDLSQRGVEMKVLVEQMREQVQNIE